MWVFCPVMRGWGGTGRSLQRGQIGHVAPNEASACHKASHQTVSNGHAHLGNTPPWRERTDVQKSNRLEPLHVAEGGTRVWKQNVLFKRATSLFHRFPKNLQSSNIIFAQTLCYTSFLLGYLQIQPTSSCACGWHASMRWYKHAYFLLHADDATGNTQQLSGPTKQTKQAVVRLSAF